MTESDLTNALRRLPTDELERMGEAALRIFDCFRALQKSETNLVAEVLRGAEEFVQWEHYPEDDVIDYDSHSQYFYHAHAPDDRDAIGADEHGHFHTFLRRKGMQEGVAPAGVPDYTEPETEAQTNCHLIAISMNTLGYPTQLFTVNRWVTGDTWYAAEDVIGLLPRFGIDLALPSWPVNVWITEMFHLFRPQMEQLLRERDAAIASWSTEHTGENPYEAQEIEVLSSVVVAVDKQAVAVDAALKARGHTGFVT